MEQKKPKKRHSLAVNGNMLSGTIRKWFPLFLLPTVAAFAIGFVYPFIKGIYLSFYNILGIIIIFILFFYNLTSIKIIFNI